MSFECEIRSLSRNAIAWTRTPQTSLTSSFRPSPCTSRQAVATTIGSANTSVGVRGHAGGRSTQHRDDGAGRCAVVHAAALFSCALADVLLSDFRYVLRCVRCSSDRRRKFDRHLYSGSSPRPVAVSQFHPLKVSSESYPAPPSFPISTISASSSPSVFLTSSAGDFVSVRTA